MGAGVISAFLREKLVVLGALYEGRLFVAPKKWITGPFGGKEKEAVVKGLFDGIG